MIAMDVHRIDKSPGSSRTTPVVLNILRLPGHFPDRPDSSRITKEFSRSRYGLAADCQDHQGVLTVSLWSRCRLSGSPRSSHGLARVSLQTVRITKEFSRSRYGLAADCQDHQGVLTVSLWSRCRLSGSPRSSHGLARVSLQTVRITKEFSRSRYGLAADCQDANTDCHGLPQIAHPGGSGAWSGNV